MARLPGIARSDAKGKALPIPGSSWEFPRLCEVTATHDHAGRDRASFCDPRSSRAYLDDGGSKAQVVGGQGTNSGRCRSQQTADAELSGAVENGVRVQQETIP